LISTELYCGQAKDWWYFAPETGQHVFFYSPDAMRLIAKEVGYSLMVGRGFILFSRSLLPWRKRFALRLVRYKTLQLIQCAMPLFRRAGIVRDFEMLREQSWRHPAPSQRQDADIPE